MSALPPEADMFVVGINVCGMVPIIHCAALPKAHHALSHLLVGSSA